jgi:hypothetical protein
VETVEVVDRGTAGELLALDASQYPLNVTTTVYAAALLVKSGPGTLYGFSGYNSRTSAQFILVLDFPGGIPADTAVPKIVLTVAATSNFWYQAIPSRRFERGIVICNSSTAATKTIGSADCWFDVQYV